MRAVIIPRHGGPDVLEYREDFPPPQPGPGEALVRVHATGVNQIDRVVRLGYPGVAMPLPHVCGGDIAGVVAALGPDTPGPDPGTRVVVYPLLPCYDCALCAAGRLNLCQRWRYFGLHVQGGYAEYVAVPQYNLVPLPDSVSFADAVTLPVAGLTAWHALRTVGALQPGQTFFIWGGTGALGMLAIQLARQLGASVVATGGSPAKLEAMRAVGADCVIDRHTEDVPTRVLEFAPAGVDLALDYVGPETFNTTLGLLKKGGALLLCGMLTGRETTFNIHQAYMKHISVKGLYLGQKDELATLVDWLAGGRIRAAIDSVLPLSEARAAHTKLETGDYCGKIVLRID
jgi:NADPH:quinone reductase-like Zn-dependent oxidoreductase